MSDVSDEIASQPAVWRRAVAMLPGVAPKLPPAGARIAIIGCGTSYYMAQAIAVARESLGGGETDAFAASEMPAGRSYDAVLAISRSGTTTEVERALCGLPPKSSSLAISAAPGTPW